MELFFGSAADGRTYPHAPLSFGAVDAAIVGPAGLTEILEVQLGLAGPITPRPVRIAAYVAKIQMANEPSAFWAESFSRDPWSTATELLAFRDDLVAGGWTRKPVGARRIDDLASVEDKGPALPLGLADRAAALITALSYRPGLRINKIFLLERRSTLPTLWHHLIDAVEAAGVVIVEHDSRKPAADGTDLRRVQTALDGNASEPLVGDGSVVLVEADTTLMAAEAVADWLSAEPTTEGTVVLAPDGDTALLDRALRSRGMPALGLSSPSPWRGALQILPIAFAVAWRPFDPKALLNLLMLPRPPVPGFVARRLVRALTTEPGIDGRAWSAAWEDIQKRASTIYVEDGEDAGHKTEARIVRWRNWTTGALFDRKVGMPVAEAREIAGRVIAWALEADGGDGNPLLLAVVNAATALADALDHLNLETLPALLLDRVLRQVLADGVQNPSHGPEEGSLGAIRAPGAIWNECQSVVWWNFVGPGERVSQHPWSAEELTALSAAGVRMESAADASNRIAASYAEVLQRTSERILLVRPVFSRGEHTVAHPLAHQLRPILEDAAPGVFFRAERLLNEGDAKLANRILARQPREIIPASTGRAAWNVPAAAISRLDQRRESASSLGRLINCQLAWLVQDVLSLRSGTFAEIPGPDQLFGNLAHEIARRLLVPGPPPPLNGFRRAASELFENLLPQMAAVLQQPEYAGELAAARELVPSALESLVRLLHDRSLEVVGTELDREANVENLMLHGRLDILVRQASRSAVLDLKWTRSERRYREEIVEGRAIQLAVYRSISGSEHDASDGGYFLLRQRRILAPIGSIIADDGLEAKRTQAETVRMLHSDWEVWLGLARNGIVLAAGLEEAANHRPSELEFEPMANPCGFCDLTSLCRIQVEPL